MAKLSDLYAGTKKALSKAAGAVESGARKAVDTAVTVGQDIKRGTFAENVKGAFTDTAKESLDAMESGKDRGITGNLQTNVVKGLYGLGEIVTGVGVPGVGGKTDASAIQSGSKKLSETFSFKPLEKYSDELLDEDSRVKKGISAVAGLSDIYSNVIGRDGSGIEKFQKDDYVGGALDFGFAALGSMPFLKGVGGLASATATTGALGSAGALEYVSENTQKGKDKLKEKLISMGKDESTATRWANNTIDAVDLLTSGISMMYGMRLGGKDVVAKQKGVSPQNVTVLDVVKTNASNAAKSGIADTLPSAVYDFIDKSDADDGVKDTAKTLFSFAVSAVPFNGFGPKKGKTDPAQMRLGEEAPKNYGTKLSDQAPKKEEVAIPESITKEEPIIEEEFVPKPPKERKKKKLSDEATIKTEEGTFEDAGKKQPPTTTIAKELGDIFDSLQLGEGVEVSRSKNLFNELGTIGGKVEKGIKKLSDYTPNLRNIWQTARTSAPLFANRILDTFNIDKRGQKFTRDFEITPEMVVGGKTPNTGVDITDYKQVAGTIRTIISDSIKGVVATDDKQTLKDLENLARAEYVYTLNKGNQAKLQTIFTPDEIQFFKDREALEQRMYDEVFPILKDYGFLSDKDTSEDYVRFTLSQYGKDLMSKPVDVEINGQKVRFRNAEQALQSMSAYRYKGDKSAASAINKKVEEMMSSILKEKSDNPDIDLFRVHSPTVRMLSYAGEVGKLLQNKAMLDNAREFIKTDEKGKPLDAKSAAFISEFFPGGNRSEIMDAIMGIASYNNDPAKYLPFSLSTGQLMEGVAKLTRGSSAWILAGNLTTALQPILSTVPKGVLLSSIFERSYVTPTTYVTKKGSIKPEVQEGLAAFGFLPQYQAMDVGGNKDTTLFGMQVPGAAGKFVKEAKGAIDWTVAESSGQRLEWLSKSTYALSAMKRVLKNNEISVTDDAGDVVKKFTEWSRKPENKEKFIIAQDRIQENLSYMGESTIFNKSLNNTIRKTNFQALTGYINGQINKTMTDVGRFLGYIETGGKEGKWNKWNYQRTDSATRLAMSAAIYYTIYGLAKIAFSDDETDEEIASALAHEYTSRNSGNFFRDWVSVVGGITSSPVALVGDMSTQMLGIISETDEDARMQRIQRLGDTIIKTQGLLKNVNAVGDNILSEGLTDVTGGVSTMDMSKTGRAKGTTPEKGDWTRLIGNDGDQFLQNILYRNIEEIRNSEWMEKTGVVNIPVLSDVIISGKKIISDWVRPFGSFSDAVDTTLNPSRAAVDHATIFNLGQVYRQLTPDDTFQSYMGKLGIEDQNVQNVIREEIAKAFTTIQTENQQVPADISSGKGTFGTAPLAGIPGYTLDINAEFGEKMRIIEDQNPVLFNTILSGINRVKAVNDESKITSQYLDIQRVRDEIGKTPTMTEDATIAAVSRNNPNTTAMSQSIMRAYQDLASGIHTKEEIEKTIGVLDGFFGKIYGAMPRSEGLERSMAIASTQLRTNLNAYAKQEGIDYIRDLINLSPNVRKAIERGLTYKGFEKFKQSTVGSDTNQKLSDMTPSSEMTSTQSAAPTTFQQTPIMVPPKWKDMKPTWEFGIRLPQTTTKLPELRRKKLSELI